MPNCVTNCETCILNTQILLNPKSCGGVFVFTPDPINIPGPCGLTGANTYVCPLNVTILGNCKGDYKVTLLDDNGCPLDNLILRCSQFDIVDISDGAFVGGSPLIDLYDYPDYTQIVQINANNLNLMGGYISFEETAYFYRRVTQTYLNLWCGAERNGMICQIIENSDAIIANLLSDSPQKDPAGAQFLYSFTNDFLKARVVALRQLCECGKICNDQFFPAYANPCQVLKNYC
jgi:hypothetical protein